MRRLPDPPFQAALLLPRWLGDAVMASALIAPLRRLSRRPVEIWGPEYLAPIFEPGGTISSFKVYEGKGRHRGISGARLFGEEAASRANAVWVVPDSLSSALAADRSGVSNRVGRASQGRSLLLSHPLKGLLRDRQRHWIDEKADLLRPFLPCEELDGLMPAISIAGVEEGHRFWLADEGLAPKSYDVLAPGAAYGPAKKWQGFEEYALRTDRHRPLVLVGSSGEKAELDEMARQFQVMGRTCIVHGGSLDLARLARLCRDARCVISNDSGAMHLAAAAGASVIGVFLSTDSAWTGPRGGRSLIWQSLAPCSPCFRRTCIYDVMKCQEDVAIYAQILYEEWDEEVVT